MRVSPSLIGLAFAAALSSASGHGRRAAEGGGHSLVDLGRRIGGRQGVRRRLRQGRRPLGRLRHRRRRGGAHRGHQPHRRRQSAHHDAVQHRQAVRRARQQRLLANLDDVADGRQLAATVCRRRSSMRSMRDGHFYAVPVNIHGANWLFYNTKVFADAGRPPNRRPGATCWRRHRS